MLSGPFVWLEPLGVCQPIIWLIFPENSRKMEKKWVQSGGRVPCPPKSANTTNFQMK